MNLTEKEAKDKICPYLTDPIKSKWDHSISSKPQNCKARECMMWRETNERAGYCGLAGKP
jgi:hypothetical protein